MGPCVAHPPAYVVERIRLVLPLAAQTFLFILLVPPAPQARLVPSEVEGTVVEGSAAEGLCQPRSFFCSTGFYASAVGFSYDFWPSGLPPQPL
jgi:hypothetical protein